MTPCPDYYAQALREHDVDAIAAPEIDITAGRGVGSGGVRRRGRGPAAAHAGRLRRPAGQVPSPTVTEEEIDAQVDRLRGNFGELSTVDRPARDGDHLTIDIKGTRDGEPSGRHDHRRLPLRARQRHRPARAGRAAARGAAGRHPGLRRRAARRHRSTFKVLVKEVKEKVLPEVTDEWASRGLGVRHGGRAAGRHRQADRAGQAGAGQHGPAQRGRRGAGRAGATTTRRRPWSTPRWSAGCTTSSTGWRPRAPPSASTWRRPGRPPEQVVGGLREGAAEAVKADLALRAVAEAEQLEPTEDDIDAEIARLADVLPGQAGRAAPQPRARRPDARGTLGLEEEQGLGVARSSTSRSSMRRVSPSTGPCSSRPRTRREAPEPTERPDGDQRETGEE